MVAYEEHYSEFQKVSLTFSEIPKTFAAIVSEIPHTPQRTFLKFRTCSPILSEIPKR